MKMLQVFFLKDVMLMLRNVCTKLYSTLILCFSQHPFLQGQAAERRFCLRVDFMWIHKHVKGFCALVLTLGVFALFGPVNRQFTSEGTPWKLPRNKESDT